MRSPNDFCVFILTHGRPDKVITFNTLRKSGYDGQVYFLVDNEDDCFAEYQENFGAENVILFDKRETAKRFDEFDNFDDRRAIVYARNECFEIARKLGYRWFLELDDDYTSFWFRICGLIPSERSSSGLQVNHVLTGVLSATFNFFASIPAASVAYSQGGDWMQKFDGENLTFSRRKAMNTFFCSTDRAFDFVGRINEDVNTYTWFQSAGNLFFTIPLIQINQKQTQKTAGGMSDIYLNQGTFVKSFYTVMCSPSCVKIKIMGSTNRRMHHKVEWDFAVPMIIPESCRKSKSRPIKVPQRPAKLEAMTVAEINSTVSLPPVRDRKPQVEQPKTRNPKAAQRKVEHSDNRELLDQDYWAKQGFHRDPRADIQKV